MPHKLNTPKGSDPRVIERIKALRAKGRTQEEIASDVGVVQGTVSTILRAQGMGGQLVNAKRRQR